MFCSVCGHEMPDGATFCTNCGARLETEPQNLPSSPAPGLYQNGSQPPYTMPAPQSSPTPAPRPTNDRGKLALIAIISSAAAVIVMVLLCCIFLGKPFNFAQTAATTGATSTQTLNSAPQNSPLVPNNGNSAAPATPGGTTPNSSSAAKTPIELKISQVDNNSFPTVTLYSSITDTSGKQVTNVDASQFTVTELDAKHATYQGTITQIVPLAAGDAMNLNLVIDQSGSMADDYKMQNAKSAADAFIDDMAQRQGTVAEITSFANVVTNQQPFSDNTTLLKSAVDSLIPDGGTALNDALFWALQRTNLKTGSRVVIAFTDGMENSSHYTTSDVIDYSRQTGIPIYIIGVGNVDTGALTSLAHDCNGEYFSVDAANLASALQTIYEQIYQQQQAMYKITYTSSYTQDMSSYRTVTLSCSNSSSYSAQTSQVQYMPQETISSYQGGVNSNDYVLPDSSTRVYSKDELEQLSLWELYLARNEIFAKYGRKFRNQDLVDYFATKSWYHGTYDPDDFDRGPQPLNDIEKKNCEIMLEVERDRNSPYLTNH